jgi:hypothetical protein
MTSDRLLKIPVRFVDGIWECEFGGIVPVAPGTDAELVIHRRSINDQAFLKRMTAKSSIKVLHQGTTLLACLATKDQSQLTNDQSHYLIPSKDPRYEIAPGQIENWSSGDLSYVEVSIGVPTDQQGRKFATKSGGLWLITEGPKAIGLQSTQIILPKAVSEAQVNSLNHAFTKLSETYEPWRISHTGNVYLRFLYKEKNGRWFPLEFLRNAALADREQEIAHQLWQDFMSRMTAGAAGLEA